MNDRPAASSPLLSLLCETASSAEQLACDQCQAANASAGATQRAGATRRATQAIEMRLQLQEQVLMPGLRGAGLHGLAHVERQAAALRGLLCETRQADLPLSARRLLWSGITRVATLHFDAVGRLTRLALQAEAIDEEESMAQAEALLRQRPDEFAHTAEVEDEDADPVGHRPR